LVEATAKWHFAVGMKLLPKSCELPSIPMNAHS